MGLPPAPAAHAATTHGVPAGENDCIRQACDCGGERITADPVTKSRSGWTQSHGRECHIARFNPGPLPGAEVSHRNVFDAPPRR
eukprot:scaffold2296_cov88-Phaeocystis_antarctica.AAC.3